MFLLNRKYGAFQVFLPQDARLLAYQIGFDIVGSQKSGRVNRERSGGQRESALLQRPAVFAFAEDQGIFTKRVSDDFHRFSSFSSLFHAISDRC